jgi:hypothetical protein
MSYWVKRIMLKTAELLTEKELPTDVNRFAGPVPVVGDRIKISCQGRTFEAEVVWGNWPGRNHPPEIVIPLRVREV